MALQRKQFEIELGLGMTGSVLAQTGESDVQLLPVQLSLTDRFLPVATHRTPLFVPVYFSLCPAQSQTV